MNCASLSTERKNSRLTTTAPAVMTAGAVSLVRITCTPFTPKEAAHFIHAKGSGRSRARSSKRRLRCRQPRHWHAEWTATHIVEAALFKEGDRRRIAAVFAANAYFESLFLVFGDFAALSRNIAAEPISPISPLSLSRSVFCVSPTDTGSFLVCS